MSTHINTVEASDRALINRAMSAYFRFCNQHHEVPMQPSDTDVYEANDTGLQYVVLRNGKGILAVYRVTNQGHLKRLKRWPAEFNEAVEG